MLRKGLKGISLALAVAIASSMMSLSLFSAGAEDAGTDNTEQTTPTVVNVVEGKVASVSYFDDKFADTSDVATRPAPGTEADWTKLTDGNKDETVTLGWAWELSQEGLDRKIYMDFIYELDKSYDVNKAVLTNSTESADFYTRIANVYVADEKEQLYNSENLLMTLENQEDDLKQVLEGTVETAKSGKWVRISVVSPCKTDDAGKPVENGAFARINEIEVFGTETATVEPEPEKTNLVAGKTPEAGLFNLQTNTRNEGTVEVKRIEKMTDGVDESGDNDTQVGIPGAADGSGNYNTAATDGAEFVFDLGGRFDIDSFRLFGTGETQDQYVAGFEVYIADSKDGLYGDAEPVYTYGPIEKKADTKNVFEIDLEKVTTGRYVRLAITRPHATDGPGWGIARVQEFSVFGVPSTQPEPNIIANQGVIISANVPNGTAPGSAVSIADASAMTDGVLDGESGDADKAKHATFGSFNSDGTGPVDIIVQLDGVYSLSKVAFYSTWEDDDFWAQGLDIYAGETQEDLYKAENRIFTRAATEEKNPDRILVAENLENKEAGFIRFSITKAWYTGEGATEAWGLARVAELVANGTRLRDHGGEVEQPPANLFTGLTPEIVYVKDGVVIEPDNKDELEHVRLETLADGNRDQGMNVSAAISGVEGATINLIYTFDQRYDVEKFTFVSSDEGENFYTHAFKVYAGDSMEELLDGEISQILEYTAEGTASRVIERDIAEKKSGKMLRIEIVQPGAADNDGMARIAELEAIGTASLNQDTDKGEEKDPVVVSDDTNSVTLTIYPLNADDQLNLSGQVLVDFLTDVELLKANNALLAQGYNLESAIYKAVYGDFMSGEPVSLGGRKVDVSIAIPDNLTSPDTARLVEFTEDGAKFVDTEVKDGSFVFTIDACDLFEHEFAIVSTGNGIFGEGGNVNVPETPGDDNNNNGGSGNGGEDNVQTGGPAIAGAVALLGVTSAAILVSRKKRK